MSIEISPDHQKGNSDFKPGLMEFVSLGKTAHLCPTPKTCGSASARREVVRGGREEGGEGGRDRGRLGREGGREEGVRGGREGGREG